MSGAISLCQAFFLSKIKPVYTMIEDVNKDIKAYIFDIMPRRVDLEG